MKFIHRLAYYLVGFSIGVIILAFIFKGKDTSCDYSPNARVKKNIRVKPKEYSGAALHQMKIQNIDTNDVSELLTSGKVDFSKSDTNVEICNIYTVRGKKEKKKIEMTVENCPEIARILSITIE